MLIELKIGVRARLPSGKFVTVPKGSKVNYSRENLNTGHQKHVFWFSMPNRAGLASHVEIGIDTPAWL